MPDAAPINITGVDRIVVRPKREMRLLEKTGDGYVLAEMGTVPQLHEAFSHDRIREMLRRDDRAIFLEKHPEDGALLAERFNTVQTTKVVVQDGWVALPGLIPPRERRGSPRSGPWPSGWARNSFSTCSMPSTPT